MCLCEYTHTCMWRGSCACALGGQKDMGVLCITRTAFFPLLKDLI